MQNSVIDWTIFQAKMEKKISEANKKELVNISSIIRDIRASIRDDYSAAKQFKTLGKMLDKAKKRYAQVSQENYQKEMRGY